MGYVSVDKLLNYANNQKDHMLDANDIARFPTADVAPVVHGTGGLTMENDLISKSDAVGMMHLCLNACNNFEKICVYAHAIKQLEKIPTVDAAPVVHGRWIGSKELVPNKFMDWTCSECGWKYFDDELSHDLDFNYCPHCGAEMDEQEET